MKRIIINTVSESVLGIFTHEEFVHRVRAIAVENEDEDKSILNVYEASSYLNDYCSNLIHSLAYVGYSDVENLANGLSMSYTKELGDYVLLNYYMEEHDENEIWVLTVENIMYRFQDLPVVEKEQEEFHFNLRQKVSAWMNTPFTIKAENLGEAMEKAKQFVLEDNGTEEMPWDCITETIGEMSLKENDFFATKEIVMDQNIIYTNGK